MKKNHTAKLCKYVVSFVVRLSLLLTTLKTCSSTDIPSDRILLDCGSLETSQFNGAKWTGDTHNHFLPLAYSETSSARFISNLSSRVPEIPYSTARVIHYPFTYSFPFSHALVFIRFYFLSTSYLGLSPSKAYFSVKTGPYTLLSHFSPSVAADELKSVFFTKDFLVNVKEKRLDITFIPESLASNALAFINGIEIFSVPLNIYSTGSHIPLPFPGHQAPFFINDDYAIEMLYRVNVGNDDYSVDAINAFGTWGNDLSYIAGFKHGSVLNIKLRPATVTYHSSKSNDYYYAAPIELYWTARTMGISGDNTRYNLTWSFPVDSGFKYLIRLHFCEISMEITQVNQRVFKVYINNQVAEESMDLVALTGAPLVTLYRDYVVMVPMENGKKQNMSIALHPNMKSKPKYADAILNGIEILKLSDSSKNLAASIQLKMEQKEKKSRHSIIIGSTVGVILGLLITFLILIRKTGARVKWGPFRVVPSNLAGKSPKNLHATVSSGQCYRFTLAEIRTATNNFSEALVIGEGGFGKVYKGLIHDGVTNVAIKRRNPTSHQGYREFQNEINLLSSFCHMNLVSLLGYCQEGNELILVYEYMAEGTLRDHLYKTKKQPLPWNQRIEICIAAARGLHYIHTGTQHPVIHRDVKSANILLDHNLVAKIADFGLSRIGPTSASRSHVSTNVKGTFGYLDPEYYRRRKLTEKSDVYSFGVVLFEVFCGRPAVNPLAVEEDGEKIGLVEWAWQCHLSGEFHRMMDPHLKGRVPSGCLKEFVDIGIKCLAEKSKDRPTMGEVLSSLEKVLLLQESLDGQEINGDAHFHIGTNEDTASNRLVDEQHLHNEIVPMD
ncbi:receptor-like protein kinase FERONIA [Neltuma alba]|uniref:receptor-like protein kinase FERONIA n=1 Tax=Neltuma alba TaxID=207710 RepID=UPI0010A3E630|nr:receptor-like protein kinase FERONIA [Prosopis alba]